MNFTKIIAVTAALTSLASLATLPAVAETSTLKPLHTASFEVGAEHAISYFTSDNGHCNLVVTRAGEPDWDQNASFTVTRFESALSAGQSTRYEGSVDFTCAADAQSMLINNDIRLARTGAK